jgi:hypothetical protein
MRLRRREPVISSTVRVPAAFAALNVFMAGSPDEAGFYHDAGGQTNAAWLCHEAALPGVHLRPED